MNLEKAFQAQNAAKRRGEKVTDRKMNVIVVDRLGPFITWRPFIVHFEDCGPILGANR